MNAKIKYSLCTIISVFMLINCTPEKYKFKHEVELDLQYVSEAKISPNHFMLIGDGRAVIDLKPQLYTDDGGLVVDERVKDEWLEYVTDDNQSMTRFYSTNDASLYGKDITVRLKIKGTDVESEPVTFTVIPPLDDVYKNEIVIPVIFHIVQTNEDIESFGGSFKKERIDLLMEKINNTFSGIVSTNPVGVNTYIRFELAKYNQYGSQLFETGINRLTVREIDQTNGDDKEGEYDALYDRFIKTQGLVWPTDKYLNIWLLSDRPASVTGFHAISGNCKPKYYFPSVNSDDIPDGLNLEEYNNNELRIIQSGIKLRLQNLDTKNRTIGTMSNNGENELIHYIGNYLGLFQTYEYRDWITIRDYCNDTHKYYLGDDFPFNQSWIKYSIDDYMYTSENIMDDPTGLHVSVSKEQCMRMKWVLENCPDRAQWRSKFALTGQE